MIFPIGNELVSNVDFLSLPINDNDIIIVVRNSNLKQPLAIRWKDFRSGIANALNVLQDGNLKVANPKNLNFTGSGVNVTGSGETATINIPGGGGGSLELQTEGTPNAVQTLLNFIAGDYMAIQDDGSGGEVFAVVGLLSAEIVVAEMNSVINLADQSDNHATKIDMGTWDGLSLYSITYNTKADPKDGAILELEVSDTFSSTAIPIGPGSVSLTVKYGSVTVFAGTVDADRAIRFRYDKQTDVWFPISYTSASSFSIGGLPTQILYKDAANNVVGDNNATRTALGTLIKNENTGLGQFGQILISPTTAILTVQETGDDHVSNIGIFGNLGSNSILLSQRNFANTDSSQIRLHTSLIEFSGEVATVPFNYKFPLTSPSSGEVLGWVSANQLGWVTPGGSSIVNRGFNIGNGNIVVAVGLASRALVVDFNCNIISWTFTSTNITGSMSVDIIRKNGAIPVYPTDSIVGAGVKPNLSSAKYAKSAPSGWTSTALAAGDVLQIFINSNTLITAATLTLELQPI